MFPAHVSTLGTRHHRVKASVSANDDEFTTHNLSERAFRTDTCGGREPASAHARQLKEHFDLFPLHRLKFVEAVDGLFRPEGPEFVSPAPCTGKDRVVPVLAG